MKTFNEYINEQVVSLQSQSKYNIIWQKPSLDYIKDEFQEFIRPYNIKYCLNEMNFDKVSKKLPKLISFISKLAKTTEIKNKSLDELKVVIQNDYNDDLKSKMNYFISEMKKDGTYDEIISFLNSGKLISWDNNKISLTSGMNNLKQEIDYITKDGEEGVLQLKRSDENSSNYLRTYDNLVKNKSIKLPAPFVLNMSKNNYQYSLIGGRKRTTIAIQLNIPIQIWYIGF